MLPLGTIYDNGLFEGMPDRPDAAYLNCKCDQRIVINPGDMLPLKKTSHEDGHSVEIRCLGTRQQFVDGNAEATSEHRQNCAQHVPKERDGSDNANSIVCLLEFGPFRFFDAGDLTWNQEFRLVCPNNVVGEVDVYQVTHHGLDSSNNPVVLASLKPVVAIMNNGGRKGGAPEVFSNLSQTPSLQAVYQVHRNETPHGAINNQPDEFIANKHEQGCQGHHIKLSVSPSGNDYTVSIPVNHHEKTYHTKEK
jgi:hypothetical protein